MAAALAALGCAGCSIPLDSMFAKPTADLDQTGSINRISADRTAVAGQPSEADLAYARAAAAEALARGENGNSVPWQNPKTGVGGNITPLASSYTTGGLSCRDFLASVVRAGSQAWLQGSACRGSSGNWQVKDLRPLRSS